MNPIIFELSLFVTSLICASSFDFKNGNIDRIIITFGLCFGTFSLLFRIAMVYLDA